LIAIKTLSATLYLSSLATILLMYLYKLKCSLII